MLMLASALSLGSANAAVGDTFKIGGFTYTITSETEPQVAVKATSQTSLSGDVEIPSTVTNNDVNYTVTSIAPSGFLRVLDITSVSFPKTLTSIGNYAFQHCSGLTKVEIPSTITEIGRGPFTNCASLTEIVVDTENQNFTSVNGILFSKSQKSLIQFPAGKDVTSYTIPANVDSLNAYSFMDCHKLTSITIPEGVKYIGDCAIYSCYGLSTISIPASVSEIYGAGAGGRCINLSEINVDDANMNYCSVDGILFNKQKNAIIIFPAGKNIEEYTVPETVDSIAPYGFSTCQHLSAITIPAGVKSFATFTFFSCANLKRFIDLNPVPQMLRNTNVFNNVPTSMTLYVPKGSKEAYASATTWTRFTDIREIGAIMVSLNTRYVTLSIGETVELKADIDKRDEVDVDSEKWESSNPEVATVSADGVVTAVTDGTTTITVTVTDSNGDTYNDVCDITVDSTSGISIISADSKWSIDYSAPYNIYNLNGTSIGGRIESLTPGLYIIRQGTASAKILVR